MHQTNTQRLQVSAQRLRFGSHLTYREIGRRLECSHQYAHMLVNPKAKREMSTRLDAVFGRLGISTLLEASRIPATKLLRVRNCGWETLEELDRLLLEAGFRDP